MGEGQVAGVRWVLLNAFTERANRFTPDAPTSATVL